MTVPAQGPTVGDVEVTGDAAQNIIGVQVSGDVVQSMVTYVRGHPAMYFGPTQIADRVACYVPAHNHDLVVKALDANHAVALTGLLGCGRETTAIAAIHTLRPGIPIRRFSADVEDVEEIGAKGVCGYLVRAADEELTRLRSCVDAVRAAGGYLVVVGDETEQGRLGTFLPCMAVEPPHPVRVYRHRLASRGLTGTQWPHWDQAPVLLEHALPADARRLADLVEEIERRGGDIAAQQAEVARAYRRWAEELRGWFEEHPQPRDRALLVAAATLAPVEETTVYSAALSLTRRLQITVDGAGLAWCPVTGLCGLLGAEREGDRIVFRRHGYAESTLRHVWDDYPLTHPDLLSWLAALPTDEAVPARLRNSLVETFADLAAEHGAAGQVVEAARKWAEAQLADLACIALSRTCLHRRIGGRIRRALYDWSLRPRTPQTLKLTIARVCEPLGQTYPLIALTRLKHLATHGDTQVVCEVINAALSLAEGGRRREVLAAALAWSKGTGAERLSATARHRRIRAGATLFLKLAGRVSASGLPEVLEGDGAVDPLECAPAWRAALYARAATFEEPDAAFEEVVHRWLDTAVGHPQLRGRIVWAFIDAATPSSVLAGPANGPGLAVTCPIAAKIMINVVRRWAAVDFTDPVRREIKENIVIPLTRPWWLRLLKAMYARLWTLVTTALQPH